jgi:pyridoxamine 5'-phosphate oxidase
MAIPRETNPITLFHAWFDEAKATDLEEPTAASLATTDAEGRPDVRIVLVKAVDDGGFVFYTNLGSTKAQHLEGNPHAALCFYWMPLSRQVRVRGTVELVTPEEADAYFASRPRESKIGAWASDQSQPLTRWMEFEGRIAKYAAKYGVGQVPRPDFWSGYRLRHGEVEFWERGAFRLHHRLLYRRTADGWVTTALYP